MIKNTNTAFATKGGIFLSKYESLGKISVMNLYID